MVCLGIPLDLLIADFPHDALWTSLMAEVVLMDESFKQKLRDLDIEYLHVIGQVVYLEQNLKFDVKVSLSDVGRYNGNAT